MLLQGINLPTGYIHAPIIHRIVTPRPNAPWYTDSLHTAKRLRRTLEQRWRCSKKQSDKVAKQLSDTIQKYYITTQTR